MLTLSVCTYLPGLPTCSSGLVPPQWASLQSLSQFRFSMVVHIVWVCACIWPCPPPPQPLTGPQVLGALSVCLLPLCRSAGADRHNGSKQTQWEQAKICASSSCPLPPPPLTWQWGLAAKVSAHVHCVGLHMPSTRIPFRHSQAWQCIPARTGKSWLYTVTKRRS